MNDLLNLLQEVSNFSDFSHLKYWDVKGDLTRRADESVEKLRTQTKGYFEAIDELKKAEEQRAANIQKIKKTISFSERLEELNKNFFEIATNNNAQFNIFETTKQVIEK